MLPRLLSKLIQQRLGEYPSVALFGPRQSGKTTLAHSLSHNYFDLERPEDQLLLDIRWDEIIRSKELVVFDEAQELPQLFPRLRAEIDRDRKRNGRFLLLGSISPALMRKVSESLAGRLAICEMSPLLLSELPPSDADSLWLRGGYPDGGILGGERFSTWQKNYLQLLAQRDLPHWGLPAKPQITERLFKMLAVAHGQVWNSSQLGSSLGINYHTVNHYIDYLQMAYLIRSLSPFYRNLKKRMRKSPKIYWRDSGLLHSLMNIASFDELLVQPWVGHSWEGWVIEQILSYLSAQGKPFEAYYLRTSDNYEADLILNLGNEIWSFEIKLTTSPVPQDRERLKKVSQWIGATKMILVSRTEEIITSDDFISTNIGHLLTIL